VTAENVTATQLLHIRHDFGSDAEIVFGKNSSLKSYLVGGIGLIFTNSKFTHIKEVIDATNANEHFRKSSLKLSEIENVEIAALLFNDVPF
jgi:ribosomal protein L10